MTFQLSTPETLLLDLQDGILHVTMNRPERRNALNSTMVAELIDVFSAADGQPEVRALVLRGAGGTFCAGADIKEMAKAKAEASSGDQSSLDGGPGSPRARAVAGNRRFGELALALDRFSQPTVGIIEGAAMGGGFGLVCATDVALALKSAKFGLPETGLGLPPAQIAPFVVQRIGMTRARALALTGARFDGAEAQRLDLVHFVYDSTEALEAARDETIAKIRRCAPGACMATKRLLHTVVGRDLGPILDQAAGMFADAAMSDEGREGAIAFVEKRLPAWAQ